MNYTTKVISFRPLVASDLPMLHEWLHRSHVSEWWDNPTTYADIDQFLANPEQLGQGLGTAMISAFVNQLFQDLTVTKVQTDPSPKNERAIRCYHRVGFVDVGEVITPDGLALLMVKQREPQQI